MMVGSVAKPHSFTLNVKVRGTNERGLFPGPSLIIWKLPKETKIFVVHYVVESVDTFDIYSLLEVQGAYKICDTFQLFVQGR